jgi:DNA-directed RNA polymerase specialized sigma24 family protein
MSTVKDSAPEAFEKPRRRRPPRPPLTAAQREAVAEMVPLALDAAAPMQRLWPWLADEMESAALAALVSAAQTFDPSRRVPFGAFAIRRVHGALKDVLRRQLLRGWGKGDAEPPYVRRFRDDSERDPDTLVGAGGDPPVGADLESADLVDGWLRHSAATPRQAEAVRGVYLEGRTLAAVGAELGCSDRLAGRERRAGENAIRESARFHGSLAYLGKEGFKGGR